MKNLFSYFLIIIIFSIQAFCGIDISKGDKISLLEHSKVYITNKNMNAKELYGGNYLLPYSGDIINLGISQKYAWVAFTLTNSSKEKLKRFVIPTWPLIEDIELYDTQNLNNPKKLGLNYMKKQNETIFYHFPITLKPGESKTFLMKLHSNIIPVEFKIVSQTKESFYKEDRHTQFIDTILIGAILALAFYSFLLYFYIKDLSSLFYSIYLITVTYQQVSYLGLSTVYFPLWFIEIDKMLTIVKLNLLIITFALYAYYFLKIEKGTFIYKIYVLFIIVSLIETALFGIPPFYNLYPSMVTGTLFIIFNLYSGVYSYLKGNKQARLFIAGFAIVIVSFAFIISDSLGLSTYILEFQNLLMYATALEALIFMLAFADRYILMQREKELAGKKLLAEIQNRNRIINAKVLQKTQKLNDALKTKELLIKEIHHRVKNNLQIILSMLRMHNDDIRNKELNKKLTDLENRINAIAKTYSMLLTTDKLELIDMNRYINSLVKDIKYTYQNREYNVKVIINTDTKMVLKKAVYIGLIINEIVSNAFKHAFFKCNGNITITLKEGNNGYILEIEDDGEGEIPHETNGLGLKLINRLIKYQLDGTCALNGKRYHIRFK